VCWGTAPVRACPFCSADSQTLTADANQASMVVFGTLKNPKLTISPDGFETGTTELEIKDRIKEHPSYKDKNVLVIPRYLPIEKGKELWVLVFVDIFKDRIDPYKGMPVKDDTIATYLRKALKMQNDPVPERLSFFFDYLGHDELEVSLDAYKEFAKADYKDVMAMLKTADKKKLAADLEKWLKNKDTPTYRYGLYGYLFGMCGRELDEVTRQRMIGVLLELLGDPERGLVSGIDGVLAGYVLLDPVGGWQYLSQLLLHAKPEWVWSQYLTGYNRWPEAGLGLNQALTAMAQVQFAAFCQKQFPREFSRRYAALRTLRYFWDYPEATVSQGSRMTSPTS
jgi:hypothetical protein